VLHGNPVAADLWFQSLFCWIEVLEPFLAEAPMGKAVKFQSLFCWIEVLERIRPLTL